MRLIDANEAIKAILYVRDNDLHHGYPRSFEQGAIRKALRCIEETPAIEAEPVRHGEWIDRYGGKYANHLWECSECKEKALWRFEVDALGKEIVVQDLSDFCPGCGAKMDGE